MKEVRDLLGNLMIICVVGFVLIATFQVLTLTALEEILEVVSR